MELWDARPVHLAAGVVNVQELENVMYAPPETKKLETFANHVLLKTAHSVTAMQQSAPHANQDSIWTLPSTSAHLVGITADYVQVQLHVLYAVISITWKIQKRAQVAWITAENVMTLGCATFAKWDTTWTNQKNALPAMIAA